LNILKSNRVTKGNNISNSNVAHLKRKYIITGIIFLMPATILYLVFTIYPFADSLLLSFQSWDGFSERAFIGLHNYIKALADDTFILTIKNSVYLGFVSAFFSVIVGLVMAWLMLYVGRKEGNLYRTILFSPGMIPAVITSLLFTFVFNPDMGMLNKMLEAMGLSFLKAAWLTDKGTVLNCIVFVAAWKQFGLTMVLCFAGLQGIPDSMIESARLDGASDFKVFKKIIIPLIRPVIELSAMFALMSGLKIYDSVISLTAGGPGRMSTVIPMWIVENAFTYNDYGYSSSMAMIFVVVILIGMVVIKRIFKGETYEY
jgi:ABC-type sugar transport system permease subunit